MSLTSSHMRSPEAHAKSPTLSSGISSSTRDRTGRLYGREHSRGDRRRRCWAYLQAKHVEGAGLTEDGDVYAIFSGILGDNALPPDLEAGVFRALKRVPGVTVSTVNVLGHRVLSLAPTEDWLREELFLDPKTYGYRGQRGTVVHDAVIDPAKAGNATGAIAKGHTATSIRLRTAVVDRVGER
jgi:hypothetical protein